MSKYIEFDISTGKVMGFWIGKSGEDQINRFVVNLLDVELLKTQEEREMMTMLHPSWDICSAISLLDNRAVWAGGVEKLKNTSSSGYIFKPVFWSESDHVYSMGSWL